MTAFEKRSEVPEDSDSWCTPEWLCETLGHFTLASCRDGTSRMEAAIMICILVGKYSVCGRKMDPDEHHVLLEDAEIWYRVYRDRKRKCFIPCHDCFTKAVLQKEEC